MQDELVIMIVPFSPPIARHPLSGDIAIEHMSSVCRMKPIRKWVDVSQKVTEQFVPVEHAINLPCLGIAMHELKSLLGTCHS